MNLNFVPGGRKRLSVALGLEKVDEKVAALRDKRRCTIGENSAEMLSCPLGLAENDESAAQWPAFAAEEKEMELGTPWRTFATQDASSGRVCVACMPRNATTQDWLQTQLLAHCRLHHPHVVQYRDVLFSDDEAFVVIEHPNGQDLLSYLSHKSLSEDEARNFFQQLVFTIEYFHQMGVKGLDLRLEDIFLDSEHNVLKVIHFGYRLKTTYGEVFSLPYVTPEQLRHPQRSEEFREESDIWSLGVVLFSLLFQTFPFLSHEDSTEEERLKNILQAEWRVPIGKHASIECRDLLGKIFELHSSERITLDKIKIHPWYKKDLPQGVVSFENTERPPCELLEKAVRLQEVSVQRYIAESISRG